MSVLGIEKSILNYYDKNNEKYTKFMENVRYIRIKFSDENLTYNIIQFYDYDDKLLFESRYEVLGVYNNIESLWWWSWSNPGYLKYVNITARKILNYGLDLDIDYISLKAQLITSRFKIVNKIQLDLYASLASYITKIQFIYPHKVNLDDLDKTQSDIYTDLESTSVGDNYNIYYFFILDFDKLNLN
jgi:hypothetical protein